MNLSFYFVLVALNFFIWQTYDLPSEPMLYIVVLCSVYLMIAESIRFNKYRTAKKEMDRQLGMSGIDIPNLPVLNSRLYQDYLVLLERQEEKYRSLESVAKEQILDMKRYYGLLVHQMKTPISGISLLLSEEEMDRSALKRELYRVEQYVDSILWYQRFRENNHDLLIQVVSGEEIIKQAIKRNSVLLMRKGIRIQLDLSECRITTDKKWLEFILDQLLGNAEKYTKIGTIRIVMKEYQDWVDISVKDTGIGIREEDQNRIFEWGYTGYNGHENQKSTGIGLALCKQAADLLGYKILLSSEVGVGTCMTIRMYKSKINIRD